MKWLRWMLPLLVLFAFAMPAWGAYVPLPGDVVIEQAVGPPDQVPDVIRTGTLLISAEESKHSGLAATYDPLEGTPVASLLMRSTSGTVQTVVIRLWRPEGGVVAFRHSLNPNIPRA